MLCGQSYSWRPGLAVIFSRLINSTNRHVSCLSLSLVFSVQTSHRYWTDQQFCSVGTLSLSELPYLNDLLFLCQCHLIEDPWLFKDHWRTTWSGFAQLPTFWLQFCCKDSLNSSAVTQPFCSSTLPLWLLSVLDTSWAGELSLNNLVCSLREVFVSLQYGFLLPIESVRACWYSVLVRTKDYLMIYWQGTVFLSLVSYFFD